MDPMHEAIKKKLMAVKGQGEGHGLDSGVAPAPDEEDEANRPKDAAPSLEPEHDGAALTPNAVEPVAGIHGGPAGADGAQPHEMAILAALSGHGMHAARPATSLAEKAGDKAREKYAAMNKNKHSK